jgi:hypothetical protein
MHFMLYEQDLDTYKQLTFTYIIWSRILVIFQKPYALVEFHVDTIE